MTYQIRSVMELPYGTSTSKYAYVSARDFQRWFGDHEEGLMVLQLTSTSNMIRYVAVSGLHTEGNSAIYVPLSIYQEFELTCVQPIRATATLAYELEKATKLVLKPLDPILYSGDMRAVLEEALMDYPLLQKHTQFTVYLESLGGYAADVWVEDLEPAEVVQLGGEVEVEFVPEEGAVPFAAAAAAATDAAVSAANVAAAAVAAVEEIIPVFSNGGMSFPVPSAEVIQGQVLGSATTSAEQPLTTAQMREARLAFYQKKTLSASQGV